MLFLFLSSPPLSRSPGREPRSGVGRTGVYGGVDIQSQIGGESGVRIFILFSTYA